jgi:hypothetical protein
MANPCTRVAANSDSVCISSFWSAIWVSSTHSTCYPTFPHRDPGRSEANVGPRQAECHRALRRPSAVAVSPRAAVPDRTAIVAALPPKPGSCPGRAILLCR